MSVAIQTFAAPTRDSVSDANRAIFDKLKAGLGFVPNWYAAFAHSETALGDYIRLRRHHLMFRLSNPMPAEL